MHRYKRRSLRIIVDHDLIQRKRLTVCIRQDGLEQLLGRQTSEQPITSSLVNMVRRQFGRFLLAQQAGGATPSPICG